MATKPQTKRSTAANVPASDRKVGKTDNMPFTVETFEATITELGSKVRLAEAGLIAATEASKATKADSMIAFTDAAEKGVLSDVNFGRIFALWRYGDATTATDLKHRGEESRFRKAMRAGIAAMASGVSFVDTMKTVQKTANDMIAARAAVKGDARKALPEARQADLAVYNVLNRMEEKAGGKDTGKLALLNADELRKAILKAPTKTAAEQSAAERLQSMIDTINTMSKDAPKALRETYRSARNALEDLVASLEPGETEEESETEAA